MKKLFVHIGPPKTGSTTIQGFLYQNKDILYNFGYLYPETGMPKNLSAQHNLGFIITKRKEADVNFGNWKEFHQEVKNVNVDNIIISTESFGRANKEQIAILKSELNSYDVKIIAYVRRQDLRAESQYTQSVKFGWCATDILSFIEQKRDNLNYYKLLEPWKQNFGIDHIIVRPLEKTQIPDISHDILKIIGITNFEYFSEIKSKNIKPGRKALEVLKVANKMYETMPKKQRQKCIRKIDKYLETNLSEEKSKYHLLSYADSVKILERYKESNQAVAKEYLGREDGILFYEKLEKYEEDNFTLEGLSREELLSSISAFQYASSSKK